MGVESLAGLFHPHAIEVQDFAYYALIVDLRSPGEFQADHIPGAVNIEAPAVPVRAGLTTGAPSDTGAALTAAEPAPEPLWPALEAAVSRVRLDQAILVYCGRGGLVSTPVARALRWRGWSTDVLGGGWINYRRWVLAGLETLPRLVPWRRVACTLDGETARVLGALRAAGQQVLDIGALAGPAQHGFDSQLLQAMRDLDPRQPVWTGDVGETCGAVTLPGALIDALAIAPVMTLQAPLAARVAAWVADEPATSPGSIIDRLAAEDPAPPQEVLARWRQVLANSGPDALMAAVLEDWLDPNHAVDLADRSSRAHVMAPLVVESLAQADLLEAVRQHTRPTAT